MTISTSLWNHVTAGSWRANHLMCIQDGISPNRHLHHHKAIPKVWKQQRSRPFIWAGQRKQSSFLSNLLLGWLGWLPVWPSVQCKNEDVTKRDQLSDRVQALQCAGCIQTAHWRSILFLVSLMLQCCTLSYHQNLMATWLTFKDPIPITSDNKIE